MRETRSRESEKERRRPGKLVGLASAISTKGVGRDEKGRGGNGRGGGKGGKGKVDSLWQGQRNTGAGQGSGE